VIYITPNKLHFELGKISMRMWKEAKINRKGAGDFVNVVK
jgi:hypothetical protein